MPDDRTEAPKRGRRVRQVPAGDSLERSVCLDCGHIQYDNPKIVAGAVTVHDGRLLLCRRAIEPGLGKWTITAGYLELHETPEDGARREAWEEARARIRIDTLLGLYTIPRISQVQLIYRAILDEPRFEPGEESQEVALFSWADVPWEDLAFPSVHWALRYYWETRGRAVFPPGTNRAGERSDL